MRASPVEYLNLRLRAHELLHDVPLYDVSIVDLPGGGAGRSSFGASCGHTACSGTLPLANTHRRDTSSGGVGP